MHPRRKRQRHNSCCRSHNERQGQRGANRAAEAQERHGQRRQVEANGTGARTARVEAPSSHPPVNLDHLARICEFESTMPVTMPTSILARSEYLNAIE